jgi:arylsulfatase A-like enzyme
VDVDRYIHRRGYDDFVIELVARAGQIAEELAERGTLVVAHADHGLVPTRTEPAVEQLFGELEARGCALGGAGRTRWIYPTETVRAVELRRLVEADVPSEIRVQAADELFAPRSLARRRVGDVVLVAEGEGFVTSPGYRFDHGSLQPAEVEVPCAVWHP